MYVHKYVRMYCMYVCMYVLHVLHVCTACIYVFIYVVCMYVCMYVCMFVHKYVCMFVCMALVNFTLDGSDRLLRALVTVVVAMVPPPEELLRLHKDDAKALVEKIQAVIVLKKGAEMSRFHVFQQWHLICASMRMYV